MMKEIERTDQMNRTLVLIKPQAVDRGLTGKIVARYEEKGLKIIALKMCVADEKLLEKHYEEHIGKSFYSELINAMQQGPVIAIVLGGSDAVTAARVLNGATDPVKAAPGTIRGDFGLELENNVVHASDSIQSATREIKLWFPDIQY